MVRPARPTKILMKLLKAKDMGIGIAHRVISNRGPNVESFGFCPSTGFFKKN